ncbi:MAG: zinc ABC transporter substrate-binding protein [Pirellulales bacterium]|nr:zinc ABC transporter substrate-binding protein [Pirellulales bacterium]
MARQLHAENPRQAKATDPTGFRLIPESSMDAKKHLLEKRKQGLTPLSFLVLFAVGMGCSKMGTGSVPAKRVGGARIHAETSSAEHLVGVSNAYLAAAIHDLLGDRIELVILAEPGMCPGHFDLRPSQVRKLRRCEILVRFDFQSALDARLAQNTPDGPTIIAVGVPGGMCEPASYESACRQIHDALIAARWLDIQEAESQMTAIHERLETLTRRIQEQIHNASLEGTPVLCSGHQEAFCRFLGLHVAATFPAADAATPSQIDWAVNQGDDANVQWIIANLPEGRQLADALAQRLQAAVVVFENFPDGHYQHAFDALVQRNVQRLVDASNP